MLITIITQYIHTYKGDQPKLECLTQIQAKIQSMIQYESTCNINKHIYTL